MASPVVDVKSPVRSPVTDWRPVPAALADHQPADSPAARLAAFFRAKGIFAIKQEDQREQWYDDWLVYQTRHQLYAGVLSPNKYSTLGNDFNLLRLARFVELFAYFSPGHAYSLQVTFLGLFSILMGTNEALKHEAVEALEAGGLLAFAISEKSHGADLFGNEFTLREMAAVPPVSPVRFRANGSKYYIGNANAAAIVSILARKEESPHNGRSRRAPFALFALRPPKTAEGSAYGDVKKIRTLGVRAAFVGEFTVTDHELSADDIIVEGRAAWDAVFGTVTLGKFFLGFGAIGICEHAFAEAVGHLSRRLLYGKPVIDMPHI
ncbi:MAG TPA: acyl-CoA dehydrogenase family protein, partial [Tepidisphaeraceae bacterium]